MLRNDIQQGISQFAEPFSVDQDFIQKVSDAIADEALSDPTGREILTLSREGEQIVHYHLFKAITAAAGVLGTAMNISMPITVPAALCAISALSSLHGLREKLPMACGRIVEALYVDDDKEMSKKTLLAKFEQCYDGPPEEMKTEFDNGLETLDRIRSIRVEQGKVRLVELIVVRL